MKILISGASGFVGRSLMAVLAEGGNEIFRLVRRQAVATETEILWDPDLGKLSPKDLEGFDAVVHLSGENIATGRWTIEKKRRIRQSRVKGTQLLSTALAGTSNPPKVLVCASAVGYYGDRGEEIMNEESSPGRGFLPDVCLQWEASSRAAADRGIRTAKLRIGTVLSPSGGALARMVVPFRLGLGGKIGGGNQFMSWITMEDLLGIIMHVIESETLSGPINAVTPNAVRNAEFTKTLGRVLSRPAVLALPRFAARLLFGEMGEQLLLASTRVEPAVLKASGYRFRFPQLEPALRHMLGKH